MTLPRPQAITVDRLWFETVAPVSRHHVTPLDLWSPSVFVRSLPLPRRRVRPPQEEGIAGTNLAARRLLSSPVGQVSPVSQRLDPKSDTRMTRQALSECGSSDWSRFDALLCEGELLTERAEDALLLPSLGLMQFSMQLRWSKGSKKRPALAHKQRWPRRTLGIPLQPGESKEGAHAGSFTQGE